MNNRWKKLTNGHYQKFCNNKEYRIVHVYDNDCPYGPKQKENVIFGLWEDEQFIAWEYANNVAKAKRIMRGIQ